MTPHRTTIFSKMPKALPLCLLALCFWILNGARSANADSITFNFDSLANGATAAQIQTYMNNLLSAYGASVVVGSGAEATTGTNYDGDGHNVGPTSGSTVTPLTLGNTNGCTVAGSGCTLNSTSDTFIQNIGGTTSPDNEITFTFSGINLSNVSFDYEIFPNASCTALSSSDCGGSKLASGYYPDQPDINFEVDGTSVFQTYGYAPGTNGSYTHSPSSGTRSSETAPQALGTWSGAISGDSLAWVDWPATIGIDNLVITFNTPPAPVPEPSSLLLMGTGLLGVAKLFQAKRKASKA